MTVLTQAPASARRPHIGRRILRDRAASTSLLVVVLLGLSAIFAPLLTSIEPTAIDTETRFAGPSAEHLLGTDELGRDTFSRLLHGGRLALGIAVSATIISILVGTAWGTVAGYVAGRLDKTMMLVADIAMAVPPILFALILVASLGANPFSLAVVIGGLLSMPTARIMRSALLAERSGDYCLAAQAIGVSRARMLVQELLPNTLPTLLAQAAVNVSIAIGIEASLSFIGVGIQPPDASWGTLLQQGYARVYQSGWYVGSAAAVILLAVWSFSVLGQRLQTVLDPRGDQ